MHVMSPKHYAALRRITPHFAPCRYVNDVTLAVLQGVVLGILAGSAPLLATLVFSLVLGIAYSVDVRTLGVKMFAKAMR